MSSKEYDVLIIGAGISGIGTASRLIKDFPSVKLAILDRRKRIGGTWDLFRYPGIRSDSDMSTYSYRFRVWKQPEVLADGEVIQSYVEDTAKEFGVTDRVVFGTTVRSVSWASEKNLWTVSAVCDDSGVERIFTTRFLISCTGYFNHDEAFTPEFNGAENFKGQMVHPQFWPDNLNYSGKNVIVIGSGATAITLVPAMAEKANHVTMLQRSPTYILALDGIDRISAFLSKFIPEDWVYKFARKRKIVFQRVVYLACRKWPHAARRYLLRHVRKQVGASIDMRHFTPSYMPWDERLCIVPDGDLFRSLKSGRCSVETDYIDRFTADGIRLKSGKYLNADIIVSATGLQLQSFGGIDVAVDGARLSLNKHMTYKGVLLEGVPNMAWMFGYTNASWTLKVDLMASYLSRLFRYMKNHQLEVVMPSDRDNNIVEDEGILDSLKAGYVKRFGKQLPRQGRSYPWHVGMSYGQDKKMLTSDPIADHRLIFGGALRSPNSELSRV